MRTLRPCLVALTAFAFSATAAAQGTTGSRTAPIAPGSASATPSSAVGTSEITLAVGEQYVLPAQGIRSYSEGAPGIVDVRVPQDGSRLLVVGQRQGSTSLLVIRGDGSQQTYSITVFRVPVEIVRQQVTQLLSGYNGVSLNQIGGRLFIEGGVANEAQQRRIGQIASIYPGQVESLVGIDPTIVERRINIRIDLYFVELSRNSNFAFGIAWPGAIGGGSIGLTPGFNYNTATPAMPASSQITVSTTGSISQVLPRLDILQNSGWARVHRQATIVTANGAEANYLAGGEYNVLPQAAISSVGGVGVTGQVQTIKYGTELTVTPRFDPTTSRVDLRMQADMTELTDNGANVPGRATSRVNTLVNLQLGQSIMLSGLRSRENGAGSTGLPLLSQIPFLGALFGSQSGRDTERELVVFAVPTVVEGMSRQAEDRVSTALRAYEEFSGQYQNETPRLVPRAIAPDAPGR